MNERDLLVLILWLAGLTLVAWRLPQGATRRWILPVIGAGIWCALPLWEPSMRTVLYLLLTATLLVPQVLPWPQSAVRNR